MAIQFDQKLRLLFSYSYNRYQNIVTERFEMTRPPPMSGGILADVRYSRDSSSPI
jgi:hypothetical protein